MTNPLLQPLSFPCGHTSPNRVWVAPMTNMQSHPDGTLSDDELHWLEARAIGGFGVIESCATHVSFDGQGWEGEWGIYDDIHIEGWKRAADAMRGRGSSFFAQIFHGGERALNTEGRQPLSCVAFEDKGVKQATEADVERFIEDFAAGAERAAKAGLDGVELHGAHGYLLCQFLRADINTRQDSWGGSFENRVRFIRSVMQAVRARVPADFVVGVRLSPEDGTFMTGLDLDESIQTAKWLCEDGADFIHISLWDAHVNTIKRPDEHPARAFRDALPSEVPLITAGQLWTTEDALKQLEHGADAVALGRAAITTPDWPKRVVAEGLEPLMPPVSAQQLRDRALSETFVNYMKRWPGFIHEADGGRPPRAS